MSVVCASVRIERVNLLLLWKGKGHKLRSHRQTLQGKETLRFMTGLIFVRTYDTCRQPPSVSTNPITFAFFSSGKTSLV